MPEASEQFLLAVVNADERKRDWRKADFEQKYRLFFPSQSWVALDAQSEAYEDAQNRWLATGREIPLEQPDSEYGYHVVIFRHKLRVIWQLANSGDLEGAKRKCPQLFTDVHRYLRITAEDAAFEPWRTRLREVCSAEIPKLLKNMRLCKNPTCENPYFIKHGVQLYCSIPCSADSKAFRRKRATPKNINMSNAAKARWKRQRDERRNERP